MLMYSTMRSIIGSAASKKGIHPSPSSLLIGARVSRAFPYAGPPNWDLFPSHPAETWRAAYTAYAPRGLSIYA